METKRPGDGNNMALERLANDNLVFISWLSSHWMKGSE